MERALLLAKNGEGRVSPNPMVGAVIVYDDKIIGEGFHNYFGGPHAEVNAINSVKEENRHLLKDSVMYVTLEPCSHYGKTPPCAELLIKKGLQKVVIATEDPNPLVAGRGIKMLRNAGIEVKVGLLKDESQELNKKFFKANSSSLPYIILKWARSADGFMSSINNGALTPVKFSTPLTSVWMHRIRANVDGIMVGNNTEKIDHPRLDTRLWGGNSPRRIFPDSNIDLKTLMENIRKEGITSIMVEGGPSLLKSFIDNGLYDEIRVETSPQVIKQGLTEPSIPQDVKLIETNISDGNIINLYRR